MFRNIIVNKYSPCLMIFIMAFLLGLKSWHIQLNLEAGDDKYFLDIFNHANVVSYLHERYMNWSGRLFPDFLASKTIGYHFFWKLIIPLSLLLMAISINKIVSGKVTLFYSFMTLVLLFSLPRQMNGEATSWITGAYNYLIPLACAIYCLSFILSQETGKIHAVLAILSSFIFSYQEQVGSFFLLIVMTALLIRKQARTKINELIFGFSVINFIILIVSPGNYKRLVEEMWNWFPDYKYYTILQKMSLGFDKLHQMLVFNGNFVFLFLLVLLVTLYFIHGLRSVSANISVGIISFFIGFSIIRLVHLDYWLGLGDFFSIDRFSPEKAGNISTYFSYLFILLTIVSCFILVLSSVWSSFLQKMISIMLFGAIIEVIGVGLSPTIYISSLRIDYVSEVIFLMMDMMLFHYLCREIEVQNIVIHKIRSVLFQA